MKAKLAAAFGAIRNIVPVVAVQSGSQPLGIGEMHIRRRSGWRGGPSYQFHPNERGLRLGLRTLNGTSTRELLKEVTAQIAAQRTRQ